MSDINQVLAQLCLSVEEIKSRLQSQQQNPSSHAAGWRPTKDAAIALEGQGISTAKELRELVRWGVLPVDGEHVRDVSMSPGRPSYEFNISKCAEQIAWWKGLTASERKDFVERAA